MSHSPRQVNTAAALLIGNELLSGKVADQNLEPLARLMRALGVRMRRVVVVGDESQLVADEVRTLSASHDVVFTSGGVGPTHDDLTVEAIARAFALPVVRHPRLVQLLQGVYGERCGEEHLQMARVPEGSQLLASDEVRWPAVVTGNVWMMPGVPELFRMKLAIAREHLIGPHQLYACAIYTLLEETEIKASLDRLVAQHPEVEVGSYPKWFDESYRTKVTFDSPSAEAARAAADDLMRQLPDGAVVRRTSGDDCR